MAAWKVQQLPTGWMRQRLWQQLAQSQQSSQQMPQQMRSQQQHLLRRRHCPCRSSSRFHLAAQAALAVGSRPCWLPCTQFQAQAAVHAAALSSRGQRRQQRRCSSGAACPRQRRWLQRRCWQMVQWRGQRLQQGQLQQQ